MKITAIELTNVRGFRRLPKTELSKSINVFIGANNSGKSTILNAIFSMQREFTMAYNDITLGESQSKVCLYFDGGHLHLIQGISSPNRQYIYLLEANNRLIIDNNGNQHGFLVIPESEPYNLIYPYLSKRKVASFSDSINEQNANLVSGNFTYLFSKIDRLVTPEFQPGNSQYLKACDEILGFRISSLAKGNGKQSVYFVNNLEHIPLTAMGEGVTNILGLITDLCVSEDRIFLIEEPENDIHPRALKALLNLIIEKSDTNQFFISTHSNIVMKHLGGIPDTKIFNLKSTLTDKQREKMFISELTEVPNDSESRRMVLEELGYDFFDFDLWKCWLFLEESSAEVIIRDYLIDWFVPQLKNKLKTFSAGGTGNILSKFDDFNKLFVFLHLEPAYKNKVWVLIDSGAEESSIISRMKEVYGKSGWKETQFDQFSEHNFEKYYPQHFDTQIQTILAVNDRNNRKQAKKVLLQDVINWIAEDSLRAKSEFAISAKEVINKLKSINKSITNFND